MASFNRFESNDEQHREELIRNIEHTISQLTLPELETLYYDMMTKLYVEKYNSFTHM